MPTKSKLPKLLKALLALHGVFVLAAAALAVIATDAALYEYRHYGICLSTVGYWLFQTFGFLAPFALIAFAVLLRLRRKECFSLLRATFLLEIGALASAIVALMSGILQFFPVLVLGLPLCISASVVSRRSKAPIKAHLEARS